MKVLTASMQSYLNRNNSLIPHATNIKASTEIQTLDLSRTKPMGNQMSYPGLDNKNYVIYIKVPLAPS